MEFHYTKAFVTLAALEFDQLVQFYQQLLKIKPDPFIPSVYAEFQLKGLILGIFKPKASHQEEFANFISSGMSICLEVENIEDAIASLTQMGYPPTGKIMIASHGKEIYAYDPAGNRLILHQGFSKVLSL